MDLDGTLYEQPPLRARMVVELGLAAVRSGPREGRRLARVLGAFRQVREELRELGQPSELLGELQYSETARRIDEEVEHVEVTVAEWIHERPLRHLRKTLRRGLPELLEGLAARGLLLGVFSDYPASAKLKALGLERFFELRLDAAEPDVNAFKPHPRGFLVACERWGVEPQDVLYVGDREEVDGEGARRAGMPFAIFSKRSGPGRVRTCSELEEVILAACN
ncbi:MAG: HAD family hydrolase [bacterium]|nr:HAD family hydrolase [bacterium]